MSSQEETTPPADLAPTAGSWEDLAAMASRCVSNAELAATRTNVVVGTFPEGAEALFVGEAPGAQEDAAGVPFVGRSGRLLDELLAEVGLPRERVAVANVVKCRPPGNRKPTRAETATCAPWLERQVALVDPVVICALGATAAEWALGRRGVRIGMVRGKELEREGRPLVVTYHPSAAIRGGPDTRPYEGLREDLALVAELARGRRKRGR